MSVRLRTTWLWVRISLLLLKLQIWRLLRARSSLTFRQTIGCGSTLKLIRDMIIIYSQMHRTDKCSQHSSIIWPVWWNGWVFVYELSGYGFESRCCYLNVTQNMKAAPATFTNIFMNMILPIPRLPLVRQHPIFDSQQMWSTEKVGRKM